MKLLFKICLISVCLVFPILSKECNNMSEIIIKDVRLVEINQNSIVQITLCNQADKTYLFSKRFIYGGFSSEILWGFALMQNGEEVEYNGYRAKIKEIFPQDYHSMSPNECVVLSTPLDPFFNFDTTEEMEIDYFMEIVSTNNKVIKNIEFTKRLELQQPNINEIFEPIQYIELR
jgi:hypothetical protein